MDKGINDNLKKARNGTPEEKTQLLEELEKSEGKKEYEEKKEEITKLKVEQATEDLFEYSEKLVQKLTKKLTENGLSETDLSPQIKTEYEKLKKGEITDPAQLVAVENKVTENIYQVKVNKELTNLITETSIALSSNSKDQIKQVKSKLLAFINKKNNVYYLVWQEQVKKQLAKLEDYVITRNTKTNNNLSLPTKIVIGGGAILTTIGIVFLVLKKRRKLNLKK